MMDITVQREALLKPLQAVSGVVEKKQTQPILSNILLTVEDKRLLLTATDNEIELISHVPLLSITKTGSTTVSAKKLFDICRALPEGAIIHKQFEKNNLMVRTQDSSFTLNTLPHDTFPNLEHINYPHTLTLQAKQLHFLLNKTHIAMGLQDVRHYLNGVLLDVSNGCIKAIAADGHRLAIAEIYDKTIQMAAIQIIIPRKSVLEIIRLLNGEDEQKTQLCFSEQRARIATDHFVFTTKLIQAHYPDYRRLIPSGTQQIEADRELIRQALIRVAILSNEKFRGVRLAINPEQLLISANNSDQEQANESIPLQYQGEAIEIGFNVAYLLDAFSALSDERIRFVFTDANQGVLIEPVLNKKADTEKNIYVVMPMRL